MYRSTIDMLHTKFYRTTLSIPTHDTYEIEQREERAKPREKSDFYLRGGYPGDRSRQEKDRSELRRAGRGTTHGRENRRAATLPTARDEEEEEEEAAVGNARSCPEIGASRTDGRGGKRSRI
ncbi:hypothetical protein BHE74_00020378 [Ensete ventricosum]|nr:hypothetical protein BHE74_00020378 [Ensete ventricosum]